MTTEPPTMFANEGEIEEFADELMSALGAVLAISALGGMNQRTNADASLFADVLARAHSYVEIALLGKSKLLSTLEHNRELVWPARPKAPRRGYLGSGGSHP